jgi:hypothetical protein
MRVHVQAVTSLWEPADWVIANIWLPWVDTRDSRRRQKG